MGIRHLVLALAMVVAGLVVASSISAQPTAWYNAGSELVGDDGTWDFSGRIQPVNLVQEGLTYLRVTNGPCNGSADTYAVYEVALMPPPSGETAWFGVLQPIGTRASPLTGSPTDPNAILIPGAIDTSTVSIELPNQQPNTTLTACFGR